MTKRKWENGDVGRDYTNALFIIIQKEADFYRTKWFKSGLILLTTHNRSKFIGKGSKILKIFYNMILLIMLCNCAGPGIFGVMAALDPQAEEAFQKKREAYIQSRMDKCLYDAVDNTTDEILCKAYDCECHEKLIQSVTSKGHVPNKEWYEKWNY